MHTMLRLLLMLHLTLVPAAAVLAAQLPARRAFRVSAIMAKAAAGRFEICQNKHCRKKGAPSSCFKAGLGMALPRLAPVLEAGLGMVLPRAMSCQIHGRSGA
jgi:hypothetical protein